MFILASSSTNIPRHSETQATCHSLRAACHGRLAEKIAYVLCPEKFLSWAAVGGGRGVILAFLLLPLDCCALGALGVGLHNGDLPAPLAASYVATALAFFGAAAVPVVAVCG